MTALDIPALKAAAPLSATIGRYVKLIRAGREFKACCPFHDDRNPSFTVNDDKGFYHCFVCHAHGDVLDFIQEVENVGLRDAAERIGNLPAIVRPAPIRPPKREGETEAEALRIWRQASPIHATLAETYLRSRGIDCQLPDSLRFARLRYGRRGPFYPCLIALVASPDNKARGIQRTFLNESGTGKAAVPKPKMSLGRISGGAIRLAPAAQEMVVCEGLEDGLTLQQELGRCVWVAAGVGNLRRMQLPPGVRSVVIGADGDGAGRDGAREAAKHFGEQGSSVRIMYPLDGCKDFNDEICGRTK